MKQLKVFSGQCCLCDVGIALPFVDMDGADIHTGDIVQLWHVQYPHTDLETIMPNSGLTVVVSDQYQSYSDGSVAANGQPVPFVMGIKGCGFNDYSWRVSIVKKWNHVIEGENWPAFGFSYGYSDAADAAKKIQEAQQ